MDDDQTSGFDAGGVSSGGANPDSIILTISKIGGNVARDLRKATSPKAMGVDALKKATNFDDFDPFGEDNEVADEASAKPARGPQTAKMTEERAEAARKIRESAAAKATARLEAEAAAGAETEAAAAAPDAPSADTPKA